MNNFGSTLTKAMNAQNLFCFPMEQNFQCAHVHADDLCTCQMFELGAAHFIWHFHRGQLLFGFAHRADFRDGVNAGRDIFNQMCGGFTFHQRLRGNAPLVIGCRRQTRITNHVAHRVNMRLCGLIHAVDLQLSAAVSFQPNVL